MSTILLTGGAGFIGAHTAKKLIELGHEVVIFDAFLRDPSAPATMFERYMHLRLAPLRDAVAIVRGDLSEPLPIKQTIKTYRPDIVIHFAAIAVATTANKNTRGAIDNTLLATAHLLEAVREARCVKRVVYCSSSMVYGDFQIVPCPENHPLNPKEVYGGTKLAGEVLTRVYGRRFGFEHVVVRPSAVYGPTDANHRVIQIFIQRAISGKEIRLHGGGRNQLDFTYITDIAAGFTLAALHPEAANETFNMTRGRGRSLLEAFQILKRHFPDATAVVTEADLQRPVRGALDISKARRLLGYHPTVDLEDGIARYVEWMREHWSPDLISTGK